MKRILVVGCSTVLALIVMQTNVVKTPSGLTVRGAEARAADLPPPMPPPVIVPVGKGKAPIVGKGKAPIVARG
jgi:hypothetical protein